MPDPRHFDTRELEKINLGCYELTLLQAESVSHTLPGEDRARQERQALEILDSARRLRGITPAFHLRRAAALDRSGDGPGAEAERKLAEEFPDVELVRGRPLPGGRAGLPSEGSPARHRVIPPRVVDPARSILGPLLPGGLPPQGASAGRGPVRADRLPESATRLRLDLSAEGVRRGRDARVRPGRGRLPPGERAATQRPGAVCDAGQPRRDADSPGSQ